MRFLVTGASGLIGYSLVDRLTQMYGQDNVQLILPPKERHEQEVTRHEHLVKAGYDIYINDLLNEDIDVDHIKPFDALIHLAGFTETETKTDLVYVNDVGTERMLMFLRPLLPGTRVVFSGSMCSLDRSYPDNSPQDENYPCSPRTLYGQTKLEAEHIIRRLADEIGFEWSILRFPTVYGPGFRKGGMFNMLAEGLRKGALETRLNWPGRMSVVFVEDACTLLIDLATKDAGRNSLYHASSGENPTFDEIISRISVILGIERKRIALPEVFWELVRKIVFLPGIMRLLPFKLQVIVWRVSLVTVDGQLADTSKLDNALSPSYTPLDEGIRAAYRDILPGK